MAATTQTLAQTNTNYGNVTRGRNNGPQMELLEQFIDFSDNNIDPNGSTIACLSIPANTVCFEAGLEVVTALTSDQTDATVDMGNESGDVDYWVDGFDIDGASAGAYGTRDDATATLPQRFTSAGNMLLTFAGTAGTLSAGKVRVWALIANLTHNNGADQATDVDRDLLA